MVVGEDARLFFRLSTDRQEWPCGLQNSFASAAGASCWILGGGPSLKQVDVQALQNSPAPRMSINLAGTGLIRPHFWTAYDPTQRFSRSTYLDPGIMKFVHRRRAMDLVPDSTFKVCECPNLYFFEGDRERSFEDFLSSRHTKIVDWNDSLVQAIDVVYQLGFRTVYLLGCEMQIRPAAAMRERAWSRQIQVEEDLGLMDFVKACERGGLSRAELEQVEAPELYHFEEQKTLSAAVATDFHYFRIAQYLRLCRRSLALAGMRLISVTEGSRLNDCFPSLSFEQALEQIHQQCGDPAFEQTLGRYTSLQPRLPVAASRMKDFQPPHLAGGGGQENKQLPIPEAIAEQGVDKRKRQKLAEEMQRLQQADVVIEEMG